jgi:dihydrofolate reductase
VRLVAVENVSVDGVMQAPGRPDEDTRGGFDRGGWAQRHLTGDPEGAQASMQGQGRTAGLLFGSRTYRDLVGFWLDTDQPNPFAEVLRATPKYVATRSDGAQLPYPNSEALVGEAAETVARLRDRDDDGDLVLLGSGSLLHALQAADLVDAYVLTVVPVVLGGGMPLFAPGAAPAGLQVARSVTSAAGTVVVEYRVLR